MRRLKRPLQVIFVTAVIALFIAGCINYDMGREDNNSYQGCLDDTDVFVTLDNGALDAATSSTCGSQDGASDLPESVTYECMKSSPGLGAGVMQVKWRKLTVLTPSSSCEPL